MTFPLAFTCDGEWVGLGDGDGRVDITYQQVYALDDVQEDFVLPVADAF